MQDKQTDEQEIRALVARWMEATRSGDVETVLSLIAEDAVFLLPGQPPMRKQGFAAASAAQTGKDAPRIDGNSEIQEVRVLGDWAFMWSHLSVEVTPPHGAPAMRRAGHTLTLFRKQAGKWLLARDANLLVPVAR